MAALEELQGFIAKVKLGGREVGNVTIQAASRWAAELRELHTEIARLKAEVRKANLALAAMQAGGSVEDYA